MCCAGADFEFCPAGVEWDVLDRRVIAALGVARSVFSLATPNERRECYVAGSTNPDRVPPARPLRPGVMWRRSGPSKGQRITSAYPRRPLAGTGDPVRSQDRRPAPPGVDPRGRTG